MRSTGVSVNNNGKSLCANIFEQVEQRNKNPRKT